jgi:regulator of protease activity HflC (stomatin/prohibitin superfamily)
MIPAAIILVVLILLSATIIKQGSVGVVTRFGKYQRLMLPGLNFKIPLFESVFRKVSVQNQSIELEFEAISLDQANVNFKSLIVFAAQDAGPACSRRSCSHSCR